MIIIIGGGLAGLTSAIHLSRTGLKVLMIEKSSYPRHKVCGEYLSNEILPYLKYLNVDPFQHGAVAIQRFSLSNQNGKTIQADLPLGGFGISRYRLDHQLFLEAQKQGCQTLQDTVTEIKKTGQTFKVQTKSGKSFQAQIVIGAFGKKSNLDISLQRDFTKKKAPFLGVKAHYQGDFPNDLVALYNFEGGYCGVSKVEEDRINICYLTNFKTFKRYKKLDQFQKNVLYKNPKLKFIFEHTTPIFDQPLTISQISFSPKKTIEHQVFMTGDSAGMIHPLCGNGMGMAIHSSKILSELIIDLHHQNQLAVNNLENTYSKKWNTTFRKRLIAGKLFNTIFHKPTVLTHGLDLLQFMPGLLPFLIRQTHGEVVRI